MADRKHLQCNLKGKPRSQANLIIRERTRAGHPGGRSRVAQFVYLLLNNEKVVDTVGKKAVLILGALMPSATSWSMH